MENNDPFHAPDVNYKSTDAESMIINDFAMSLVGRKLFNLYTDDLLKPILWSKMPAEQKHNECLCLRY